MSHPNIYTDFRDTLDVICEKKSKDISKIWDINGKNLGDGFRKQTQKGRELSLSDQGWRGLSQAFQRGT